MQLMIAFKQNQISVIQVVLVRIQFVASNENDEKTLYYYLFEYKIFSLDLMIIIIACA